MDSGIIKTHEYKGGIAECNTYKYGDYTIFANAVWDESNNCNNLLPCNVVYCIQREDESIGVSEQVVIDYTSYVVWGRRYFENRKIWVEECLHFVKCYIDYIEEHRYCACNGSLRTFFIDIKKHRIKNIDFFDYDNIISETLDAINKDDENQIELRGHCNCIDVCTDCCSHRIGEDCIKCVNYINDNDEDELLTTKIVKLVDKIRAETKNLKEINAKFKINGLNNIENNINIKNNIKKENNMKVSIDEIYTASDLKAIADNAIKEKEKVAKKQMEIVFKHIHELCYYNAKNGDYDCPVSKDDINDYLSGLTNDKQYEQIFEFLRKKFEDLGYNVDCSCYNDCIYGITINWR